MSDNEFGFDDSFGIQGDSTVVEQGGNFKIFEDGTYRVKGIQIYLKKDERELPVFVPQGDDMVARFKLIMLETRSTENQTVEVEVEGPPMSATMAQMVMLVRAFGGDISKLPAEATTKFLLEAQDSANRGGKVRVATVKGGWVKYVEGATPPEAHYTWEFRGFRSPDGSVPARFQEKEQQGSNGTFTRDYAYADFVVVGDQYEMPSAYAGYRLSVKINNPFDGGVASNKAGKDIPTTKIGQKGGIPIDVKRWMGFVSAFCRGFQHDWVSDPEKSSLGLNELQNPLAVVDSFARKAAGRAIGKLTFNRFGFPALDVADFLPARNSGVVIAAPVQPTELEAFYHYVTQQYGKDVFSPTDKNSDEINLNFTPKGVEWAKETLVPLWDKLTLPIENGKRYIGNLAPEQLTLLTAELRKLNGEGVNEAFVSDGAF